MFRKKLSFVILVGVVLFFQCTSSKNNFSSTNSQTSSDWALRNIPNKSDQYHRLEDFGGMAYYKPLDGRLEDGVSYPLISFTPYDVDPNILAGTGLSGKNYTLITAETNETVFTQNDLGKSFCGLFAHQNPAATPRDAVDAFFPQEIASRYAKVVAVMDGQNLLVDLAFNGGSREKPQRIKNGKGYIFYDNSAAWQALMNAHQNQTNQIGEVRLAPCLPQGQFVQSTYVVPQYVTWQVNPNIPLKIWSAKAQLARIKIGFEDYYQHEKMLGKTILNQAKHVFSLGNLQHHDLTFHGQIVPPHRRILEANTWRGVLVTGRKRTGITAFVGCNQLIEEEAILAGKGLTHETFISYSGSSISAGGTTKGEGVAEDIDAFGYVLFKDYKQRGQLFTQMNATYGGGNYLVVENADLYFNPQASVNPPWQKLRVKVNKSSNAYDGFVDAIQHHRKNYLPYTFEIDGPGNFFKVYTLGGSNRLSIIAVQGEKSVYTFLTNMNGIRKDNPGELRDYWDMCYTKTSDHWDFGEQKKSPTLPGRTASKLILVEQIPESGKRYVISRDYRINESFEQLTNSKEAHLATVNMNGENANRKPKKGQMYSNVVRTAVCWTTALNKYANAIHPQADIPANGLPLALQPGDQFTIPAYAGSTHNPKAVYTVTRKDRGRNPMYPAEFVGISNRKNWSHNFSNAQSYRFFWCQLDKDLPTTIGLTFEIKMVKSGAEELLDGKPREAVQTYKGVGRIGENGLARPNTKNAQGFGGYDVNQPLDSKKFTTGEPVGHLCYSQAELTEWYKNVNWHNGFYRQNSNAGKGFEKFAITTTKGKKLKVNPLARYSAGKVFINCTGGPIGQYSNKLNDFYVRDQIERYLKLQKKESQKARFVVVNSPDVRTKGVAAPENFLMELDSEENAPPMPKPCRDLLNALPQ